MSKQLRIGIRTLVSKADLEKVVTDMADAHDALHNHAAAISAKAAADDRVPPAGQDQTAKGTESFKQNSGRLTRCESPTASDFADALVEHYSKRDAKHSELRSAKQSTDDRAQRLAAAMQPPAITK